MGAAISGRYGGKTAEERIQERRERILEAALTVFAAKGWAGAGVKDICAAAGLTDRYLYESWTSRSALFLDVHKQAADKLFTAVMTDAAGLEPGTSPARATRTVVAAFVGALEADPRIGNILFVDPGPQDLAPERAEVVRGKMLRWAGWMEQSAISQYGEGKLDAGKLRFWSLSVVGAFRTTMVEWLAGGLPLSSDDVVEGLVRVIFDGFARVIPPTEAT